MSGRVLVTGGAGFIGSHIAEEYLRAGWEVTVLDDLSRGKQTQRSPGRPVRPGRHPLAGGQGQPSPREASTCSTTTPPRSTSASRSTSPRSTPGSTWSAWSICSKGRAEGGVKRVIFASSGGVVYGDPEIIPTPETAPKLPISPYGVSKLSGEYYLRALGELSGFERVALRYANVFGPRQDPKSEAGVVSIFVSRLLAGQPLTVFGDGLQTRDYVFVKDVARANLLAATATVPQGDLDSTAFNIATSARSATCSSSPRPWAR